MRTTSDDDHWWTTPGADILDYLDKGAKEDSLQLKGAQQNVPPNLRLRKHAVTEIHPNQRHTTATVGLAAQHRVPPQPSLNNHPEIQSATIGPNVVEHQDRGSLASWQRCTIYRVGAICLFTVLLLFVCIWSDSGEPSLQRPNVALVCKEVDSALADILDPNSEALMYRSQLEPANQLVKAIPNRAENIAAYIRSTLIPGLHWLHCQPQDLTAIDSLDAQINATIVRVQSLLFDFDAILLPIGNTKVALQETCDDVKQQHKLHIKYDKDLTRKQYTFEPKRSFETGARLERLDRSIAQLDFTHKLLSSESDLWKHYLDKVEQEGRSLRDWQNKDSKRRNRIEALLSEIVNATVAVIGNVALDSCLVAEGPAIHVQPQGV